MAASTTPSSRETLDHWCMHAYSTVDLEIFRITKRSYDKFS